MAAKKNYNEFFSELYALLRKHNIEYYDGIAYFKNDKYYRQTRNIIEFEFSPSDKDTNDADDLIYRVMIDWALDNEDKELFKLLTSQKNKQTKGEGL